MPQKFVDAMLLLGSPLQPAASFEVGKCDHHDKSCNQNLPKHVATQSRKDPNDTFQLCPLPVLWTD